jgi:hypothetical protein
MKAGVRDQVSGVRGQLSESESASQQASESASRRVSESAGQRVGESAAGGERGDG